MRIFPVRGTRCGLAVARALNSLASCRMADAATVMFWVEEQVICE